MNVLETLQEQYRRTRSKPTADRHKIKNRHPHAGENGYVKRLYPRKDEWIGLDGEGVNLCGSDTPCGADGINHKPGCHVYVLLASSTGEYITNERGLSSGEIFSFLCDLALAHPRGIM